MYKKLMCSLCIIGLIFALTGCLENTETDETVQLTENVDSKTVYCYDYRLYIDADDEESLQKSIRTSVNDLAEEQEFLSDYIQDDTEYELINEAGSRLFIINDDCEISFVFMVGAGEEEYPQKVFALNVDKDKLIPEATFDENIAGVNVFGSLLDLQGEAYQGREYMQPLQDYYTVEYTRDSDNKIISASYNVDSDEYGTFNSSGELFYDVNENVFYRRYYTTGGTRYSVYLFNEDKLYMYIDFGGTAYTGISGNPDIELGFDFKLYRFGE
ncbi:MAG: hypothetical protein MJ153_08820 [Clostridia bacterium]|nr:hypothetical protein [Clostridia bacterium]